MKTDPSAKEWMDLASLTQHYADISVKTLGNWIHDPIDPLPAYKKGKKTLVRRSDFDGYMEKHRVKPGIVDELLKEFC
jgi:hypothetical protein